MTDDRDARVREHAYRLWQQEGEPHGRDRDHWEQAEREVGNDEDAPSDDAAAPAPSSQAEVATAAPLASPALSGTDETSVSPPATKRAPAKASTDKEAPAKKPAPRRKRTD